MDYYLFSADLELQCCNKPAICVLTHCWAEVGMHILCHKHYLAKGHYLFSSGPYSKEFGLLEQRKLKTIKFLTNYRHVRSYLMFLTIYHALQHILYCNLLQSFM